MSNLTPNAITQIVRVGEAVDGFCPILQILQVKQIQGSTSAQGERYRVILSDGVFFAQGMLAKQLFHLIQSGALADNAVIRVDHYITNAVSNKSVIILLNLEVLNNPGFKIGNPVAADDVQGSSGATTATRPVQQPTLAPPMYGDVPQQHQQQQQPRQQQNMYPNQPVRTQKNPYNVSTPVQLQPQNPYNSSAYSAKPTISAPPVERSNPTEANITPISQLNPYSNRWTIKARVTNKSEIRTWSNAKGEGSLFSVTLYDSSGFDIRVTFFKEAVDKFYNMLEQGTVYTFSGGKIKTANMQYNNCKSTLEISMDQNAEIHLVGNDDSIQEEHLDLVKIADLEAIEPGAFVDIMGIVKSATPVSTIISKASQKELLKSELTVVDDSGAQISVTIWGERAKTATSDYADQPLVGFKKLKVGDYGGRSLSIAQGPVIMNPNLPEANSIRHWWNTQGAHGAIRSMSSGGVGKEATFDERKPIASIQGEQMGFNEKPDYLTFKANINFIKRDKDGGPWYTACANPEPPCKNMCKVTSTGDGAWYCDRCQQTRPNCVRRYIFNATAIDDTCTTWLSIFNDHALLILGEENTADRLHELFFDQGDLENGFEGIFLKSMYSDWVIKCKVKQEAVGDENRIKASVVGMHPLDYVKESKNLLAAISRMA